MPVDELLGEVVGFVARQAGGLAVDLVVDQIFSRYTARFFHSVGRRVIAVLTLGMLRIPSSLRMVPAGTRPRPTFADWCALIIGILFWVGLAVAVCAAIWPWR